MTHNLPPRVVTRRGMTLLEITIVISILLGLLAIIFIGAKAWKRGSDRAGCVLTLRSVQMATRSYQNLYGYNFGGRPLAEGGTQDIASHLYSKGYIEAKTFHQASGAENCPSGGHYSRTHPDIFPPTGVLYVSCSLAASDDHAPDSRVDW